MTTYVLGYLRKPSPVPNILEQRIECVDTMAPVETQQEYRYVAKFSSSVNIYVYHVCALLVWFYYVSRIGLSGLLVIWFWI